MLLIIYGKSLETNMRLIGVWLNKLRKEHYTAIKIRKHSTLLEKKSTGVFLMKKPRFRTTMYLCSYFCVRKRGRKYILCLLVLYHNSARRQADKIFNSQYRTDDSWPVTTAQGIPKKIKWLPVEIGKWGELEG